MGEKNCYTCRVGKYKRDLCDKSFCEKYHGDGDAEDFIKMVTQERKGRWTIKNGELAIWDVCSECKKMVMHRAPFYNYCPNCGADMRGEENGQK